MKFDNSASDNNTANQYAWSTLTVLFSSLVLLVLVGMSLISGCLRVRVRVRWEDQWEGHFIAECGAEFYSLLCKINK